MGLLWSRHSKLVDLTAYSSELRSIDVRMAKIQSSKQSLLTLHRSIVRSLLLYGFLGWMLIALVCLYILDLPTTSNHVITRQQAMWNKCIKIGPIVALPIILLCLKRLIDSYFGSRFRHADAQFSKLEKAKEKMLAELENRDEFKQTLQLIDQLKSPRPDRTVGPASATMTPAKGGRGVGQTPSATMPRPGVPPSAVKMQQQQGQQRPGFPATPASFDPRNPLATPARNGGNGVPPVGSPPSMPIASSSTSIPTRTGLDKVLDFILNDGPNNKYALICTRCFGHNGLVREQEVGKARYRCMYCGTINGPPLTPEAQMQLQHHMNQQQAAAMAAAQMQRAQQQQAAAMAANGQGRVPSTAPSSSPNTHPSQSSTSAPATSTAAIAAANDALHFPELTNTPVAQRSNVQTPVDDSTATAAQDSSESGAVDEPTDDVAALDSSKSVRRRRRSSGVSGSSNAADADEDTSRSPSSSPTPDEKKEAVVRRRSKRLN